MVDIKPQIEMPAGPSKYGAFHTLAKRTEGLKSQIPIGFPDVREAYDSGLIALAQTIDRHEQKRLEDDLRQQIKEAQGQPTEVAGKKSEYWENLSGISVYPSLEEVRESGEAAKRYEQGRKGGGPADKHDLSKLSREKHTDLYQILESLNKIDPALLHIHLIDSAFGKGRDFAKIKQFASIREAFARAGFSENSPEFRVAMLSMLETTARRKLMGMVFNDIKNKEETIIEPTRDPQSRPEAYRQHFRNILLGNSSLKWGSDGYYGTQFFLGMINTIDSHTANIASENWGDRARDAVFTIRNIIFMRLPEKPADRQAVTAVRNELLTALQQKDFSTVKTKTKDLVLRYPSVYDQTFWPEIGLTPEEISTLSAKLKQESPPQKKQIGT